MHGTPRVGFIPRRFNESVVRVGSSVLAQLVLGCNAGTRPNRGRVLAWNRVPRRGTVSEAPLKKLTQFSVAENRCVCMPNAGSDWKRRDEGNHGSHRVARYGGARCLEAARFFSPSILRLVSVPIIMKFVDERRRRPGRRR